jgi:hypothetical protein
MAACAALAPTGVLAADPPATAPAPVQASAPAGPSEKISTEIFSTLPFISDPKLSPDGKLIAAQVTIDGKTLVGIFDPATGKNKMLNPGKSVELNWFRWAGSDRVLISLGQTVPIYGEDFWLDPPARL